MRRLLAVIVCVLWVGSTRADNLLLLGVGSPPSSFDPATVAWVNAVVTAGGTVSGTQEGFVNTLIVGLKTSFGTNYFTSCDRIWLLASENTQQANIDIVSLTALTPHGTPTFTANQGYTGNGSSMYLDTGFRSGTNFTTSAASFSLYDRTNRTAAQTYGNGSDDGTNNVVIDPQEATNLTSAYLNGATGVFLTTTTAQGFFLSTRTSILFSLYLNGSSTAGSATAVSGGGIPAANDFILALNFEGSPLQFSTDQMAEASFCGSFTGTQSSQFQGLINAYMTSVGANVY